MRGDLDDQVIGLIEDLAPGRDRHILDADLIVDLLQAGDVDRDHGRQVRWQALDLERVKPALQIGLAFGHQLDLALQLDRHLGLDLLGEVDLVKVDVQEVAVAGAALHLADESLADRLVAELEIEQLVAANLLEGLDELATVDHDGHRVHVVAVHHPGQAALPAERLQVPAAISAGLELQCNGGAGRQWVSPSS